MHMNKTPYEATYHFHNLPLTLAYISSSALWVGLSAIGATARGGECGGCGE